MKLTEARAFNRHVSILFPAARHSLPSRLSIASPVQKEFWNVSILHLNLLCPQNQQWTSQQKGIVLSPESPP